MRLLPPIKVANPPQNPEQVRPLTQLGHDFSPGTVAVPSREAGISLRLGGAPKSSALYGF
jgi:hypothetical protein